ERLVRYSERMGGLLSRADLAGYRAEWQEPISAEYRGRTILQCPPNGHGVAALIALRALADVDLAAHERHSPECWHLLIEAMKQGMIGAADHVADPRFAEVPVAAMLAAAEAPRAWTASAPTAKAWGRSDTVYLAAVDREGNVASFINSVYEDFGTGHVADGLGFPMQNRGAGVSLDPAHPNRLEPGKRPYHTIHPGMMLRDGAFAGAFGVTGGYMQPQGHLQLLVNLLDFGM